MATIKPNNCFQFSIVSLIASLGAWTKSCLVSRYFSVVWGPNPSWGSVKRGTPANSIHWDWHQRDKSQGSGNGVPRATFSFFIDSLRPPRSFSDSALSSEACLRLQPLHEPIRLTGCAIIIQPRWAKPTSRAYPCVDERAFCRRPLRLGINLLLGEDPPSGFGQVAPDGYHRFLMILGAFGALIQPQYMGAC